MRIRFMDNETSTRLLQLHNEIAQHIPGPFIAQKILDSIFEDYKSTCQVPCYTRAFVEIKLLFNDDKDALKDQLQPFIEQKIQNSNEQKKLLNIFQGIIDEIDLEQHDVSAQFANVHNKRKCAE